MIAWKQGDRRDRLPPTYVRTQSKPVTFDFDLSTTSHHPTHHFDNLIPCISPGSSRSYPFSPPSSTHPTTRLTPTSHRHLRRRTPPIPPPAPPPPPPLPSLSDTRTPTIQPQARSSSLPTLRLHPILSHLSQTTTSSSRSRAGASESGGRATWGGTSRRGSMRASRQVGWTGMRWRLRRLVSSIVLRLS